jgi:proline dehydrogenase
MLRRLLLYLSGARWARAFVTHVWLARRVARRFVAGESLDDAIAVTRTLNARGLLVSLDCLGESITSPEDTAAVVETYRALIARIRDEGLKASVSLKLTHLGLDIDEALCVTNLRTILAGAQAARIPVTIDMESSAYTDVTLRLYRTVHDDYGFDNVGTVIQSALRRSRDDMRALAESGARIRLCKGAYLEPAAIAFPDKADVDQSYADIMHDFLGAIAAAPDGSAMLEIATHDEAIIAEALAVLAANDVPVDRYEFQMLYGIRSARQTELAAAGCPTRVYVPFGDAWYPYFMRRLAERPANMGFFLRSLFRR